MFATLLAAFDVLLHRLTGQTDLVVGIPAAGQNADGLAGLVGHCVHMLPLRNQIARGDTFASHVKAARLTLLDAYDHQDVTFGRVLQMLTIGRDPSRLPLISVVFNIDQALTGEAASVPGATIELASNPRRHETFELFINAVDTGAGMRLECQYNRDLFDAQTVRRWLTGFELLLRAFVADPGQPIGAVSILTDDDRRRLARWNHDGARLSAGNARRSPGLRRPRVACPIASPSARAAGRSPTPGWPSAPARSRRRCTPPACARPIASACSSTATWICCRHSSARWPRARSTCRSIPRSQPIGSASWSRTPAWPRC